MPDFNSIDEVKTYDVKQGKFITSGIPTYGAQPDEFSSQSSNDESESGSDYSNRSSISSDCESVRPQHRKRSEHPSEGVDGASSNSIRPSKISRKEKLSKLLILMRILTEEIVKDQLLLNRLNKQTIDDCLDKATQTTKEKIV